MTKDKALEELFLAQKPQFDDKVDFMAKLTRRLDAVEYVRQHQEATIRRYKMAMVAVFVVGIVSGIASTMWLLSAPADVPLFNSFEVKGIFADSQLLAGILQWFVENSRVLAAVTLSLLMIAGIFSIISNVQDIRNMRTSQDLVI
ncbi:MAG: hypothetical protein K6A96_03750 [Prevotella sp.]|nr:hypothetical protein [Prevotella sp.]